MLMGVQFNLPTTTNPCIENMFKTYREKELRQITVTMRTNYNRKRHHQFRLVRCGVLIAGCVMSACVGYASESLQEARDVYKEYITIRKTIGEESYEWENQKRSLADSIGVVETEIDALREAIEDMEESMSEGDSQRATLRAELETLRELSRSYDDAIAAYESRVKKLASRLPETLARGIQPLLVRLPDDPSATRLSYSQRLQNVIGILVQVNTFNSDLRLVTEVQEAEGGRREVQTLYFGLGMALFSDVGGTFAGYGVPGEGGWEWTRVDGAAAASISHALDIHTARRTPAFVSVPLRVD